ncbi:MAG: peptidoglycan DD-metalloendopeptidase family protein [FCB group bacterium]|nr:peptidoglycan DD-metalloendopeptidase family protein [FCB group bacterium]
MAPFLRFTLAVCLIFCFFGDLAAIPWPLQRDSTTHLIGNSYGEYQRYGGSPYFHPGLDILAPAGTPVYAVKSGYVKAILTISADLHWRVAIGDSSGAAECDGWLYAHLSQWTIPVIEGQWVNEGDYLGDLVVWPVSDFHHLHFVKIRHTGVVWDSNWEFLANPLDELVGITDPDTPVFENAIGTQKFAFVENETTSYFSEGSPVNGDVDIVCKAYDYINHYSWRLAPYQMEYRIEGDSSIPWTNSVCFTGLLDYANNVSSVYQTDGVCLTEGDYGSRNYYFNLTNTDGDSIIEASDQPYSWPTADFHNGQYTIYVRAWDRAGNSSVESMSVNVANYFALTGNVTIGDGNPSLVGTEVSVLGGGPVDFTDELGDFSLPLVGGGSQMITVSRAGYAAVDTIMLMNQDRSLNAELIPGDYLAGDANYDDAVNVGDAVYVINYVFKGGYEPMPYAAGNVNGDEAVNVGDAVYLINYIFKSGPPPMEGWTPRNPSSHDLATLNSKN